MATLVFFKEIKDSNLLRLGISEGEETAVYTVRERVYNDVGAPTRGSTLSDGAMELLIREDEYVRCKKRALYLLSIADNNERGLEAKLRAKGFSFDIARDVCREMVSLGYVNEDSQLERIIAREANERLYGARKIVARLAGKGYAPSRIRAAMQRLTERGEVDFLLNAEELIRRKLDSGFSDDEKFALLAKYGYRK